MAIHLVGFDSCGGLVGCRDDRMTEFDLSRISNAGKEAARAHKQLRKAAEKLKTVTDEALAAGASPGQVEHAMFKFCSTREQVVDASSVFIALKQLAAMEVEKGST